MKGTYNQRLEIIGGFLDKVEVKGVGGDAVAMGVKHEGEGRAEDVMGLLDAPYAEISEKVVESLPGLDEVLGPALRRRVEVEGLLGELDEEARERELASPFPFVQRVMADQDGEEGSGGGGDGGGEGGQWQYHVFTNYG